MLFALLYHSPRIIIIIIIISVVLVYSILSQDQIKAPRAIKDFTILEEHTRLFIFVSSP